jgi:hypothetical protein
MSYSPPRTSSVHSTVVSALLILLVTASTTLGQAQFRNWHRTHFSAAERADVTAAAAVHGPRADPDGDGIPNLIEYAFDGDPRAAHTAQLPTVHPLANGHELRFTRHRAFVEYLLQHAPTPTGPWTTAGLEASQAVIDSTAPGAAVAIPLPAADNTLTFVRVAVTDREPRMQLGTNLWNFAWGGGRSDYFLPANQINWQTVENPWLPRFLEEMAIYRVIRFMDQVPINSSTLRNWSNRVLPTANHHTTARGAVAYEWQIDLCNRLGADLWVVAPHLAIETYEQNPQHNFFTELAAVVKLRLRPDLNVYVEYSNETWSSGSAFNQGDYLSQRGLALGFSTDSQWAKFYFHVYAATRLHKAFLDAFADTPQRVKPVIAGHTASFLGTRHLLRALNNRNNFNAEDQRLNPYNIQPTHLAIANYCSTDDGAAPAIRTLWREQLAVNAGLYQRHRQELQLAQLPLRLISYEGGQHYTLNAHTFSTNPDSYAMYYEWLESCDAYFDLTMHYTHVGTWASGGAWGAKSSTNQSLANAHRYRALVHWQQGIEQP